MTRRLPTVLLTLAALLVIPIQATAQMTPDDDPMVAASCLKIQGLQPGNSNPVRIASGSVQIILSRYQTYGYKVVAEPEGLVADGGLPMGSAENSTYIFVGKSVINLVDGSTYIFEGDPSEPITFVLLAEQGLVYLDGKGQVTLDDGEIVKLPCG